MNTDTGNENGSTGDNQLQGAFGDKGTNVNAIVYGHPHADKIIEEAEEILRESETGRLLLKAKAKGNIPVSVMKGTGESGFSPDARIIYVQIPGKVSKADAKFTLQYTKALREADQDLMGYKAPDRNKDVMEYATVMHTKNIDSITYVCKVVKELTNSSHFPVLIDAIDKIGYKDMYKVYERNGSQDELMKAYAGY